MRNLVKGRGRDLGRLKVYARAGIAEGRAASCLVGIVVIEAELGLPAMLAVYVNISSFFIASPRAVARRRRAALTTPSGCVMPVPL